MKDRKLRVVWCVAWSIAAMLFASLWVWSYWQIDHLTWNSPARAIGITGDRGLLIIQWVNDEVFMPLGWSHVSFENSGDYSHSDDQPKTTLGFGWQIDDGSVFAYIPYWFLTLAAVVIAFASPPRFKRFSLRALLIATTLIAVALGLIAWGTR